jgi:hypothetical protein
VGAVPTSPEMDKYTERKWTEAFVDLGKDVEERLNLRSYIEDNIQYVDPEQSPEDWYQEYSKTQLI